TTRAGIVRTTIYQRDRKKDRSVLYGSSDAIRSSCSLCIGSGTRFANTRSMTKPPNNTATAAINSRVAAIFGENSKKVRTKAAGLSEGDASMRARDGASRDDCS